MNRAPTCLVLFFLFLFAASPTLSPSPRNTSQPNEGADFGKEEPHQYPHNMNPAGVAKTSSHSSNSIQKEDNSNNISNDIIVAATVVMALATAMLVFFNFQLVCVTRDLHVATEEALHVSRPFLLVTDITSDDTVNDMSEVFVWTFKIILRNFGVSPADIVDYFVEAEAFDPPRMPTMKDPVVIYRDSECNRLNASLIGPNETVPDRIIAAYSCRQTERALVATDSKRIGIHGRIRYRGAPAFTYVTYFFWWYFPDNGSFVRASTKALNDHT